MIRVSLAPTNKYPSGTFTWAVEPSSPTDGPFCQLTPSKFSQLNVSTGDGVGVGRLRDWPTTMRAQTHSTPIATKIRIFICLILLGKHGLSGREKLTNRAG